MANYIDYIARMTIVFGPRGSKGKVPPLVEELYTVPAQIGDAIITGETILYDNNDTPIYDLLLADGSSFDGEVYPLLAEIYTNLTLPNLPTETGSPFPYKIVGDLT
jgi:hypothetical protein